jgi:hypothetical protein
MNNVFRARQDLSTIGGRLVDFMSVQQRRVLMEMLDGEEKEGAAETLLALAERIEKMPKTYETDNQGDNAIVYLHYFYAAMDWYFTEKDMFGDQHQAFGYTKYSTGGEEMGYISLPSLLRSGEVELDLYWTPKPLKDVK